MLLQGLNVTALREIKLLKEMKSPHIIALHDVFEHKKSLNLVRAGFCSTHHCKQAATAANWPPLCTSIGPALPLRCGLPSCRMQVMEFMASDLEAIIKDQSIVLSPSNVKAYMQVRVQMSIDINHLMLCLCTMVRMHVRLRPYRYAR